MDEERRANIIFIGPSGTGKSVSLYSAVYTMIGLPENGGKFSLISDKRQGRTDFKIIKNAYANMRDGTLPNGSAENRIFEFQFTRQAESICTVRWMDFQGAMINDTEVGTERAYEEFQLMVQRATILVFIIPGDIINHNLKIEKMQDETKKQKIKDEIVTQVNELGSLLDEAIKLKEEENEKVPILFYVTKSDLIDYVEDDQQKIEKLLGFLKQYKLDRRGWKLLGCQSTLGKDIVINETTRKIERGFKPEGFEIPIMLTVGYLFSEEGRQWEVNESNKLQKKINEIQEQITDQIAEKKNVNNKFKAKFFNIFGKEVKASKKIKEKIKKSKDDLGNLQKQQNALESENKQYSNEILQYIETHAQVFYLDEQGKRQPLKEFFNWDKK